MPEWPLSTIDEDHLTSAAARAAVELKVERLLQSILNSLSLDDIAGTLKGQRAEEEASMISEEREGPHREEPHGILAADRYLQNTGVKTFTDFEEHALKFDSELRNFASAASQLGSSVGVLSSSHNLRARMSQVLHLFRKNAAALYPLKVPAHSGDTVKRPGLPLRKSWHHKVPWLLDNPPDVDKLTSEDMPERLQLMARDLSTFLAFVNEFPESLDEAMNMAILSVNEDLKYWASCLEVYKGRFDTPEVRRYIHTMCSDLGEHVALIASSLSIFVHTGVPAILVAQTHANQSLLNISTVATIFTAVTATTLQFSFNTTGQPLADAVNACWFTSLVLSIGAAVNSWLAVSWRQATYRSPRHLLPWWVRIWINSASLAFLVLSVACFSLGLILFSFSSKQHIITRILTSLFSACSIVGLASVSTWFGLERWIFSQHHGTKWLADVVAERWSQIRLPLRWLSTRRRRRMRKTFRKALKQIRYACQLVSDGVARMWSNCRALLSKRRAAPIQPHIAGLSSLWSSYDLPEGDVLSDTDSIGPLARRFSFRIPTFNNPLKLRRTISKDRSQSSDYQHQRSVPATPDRSSWVSIRADPEADDDRRARLRSTIQSLQKLPATTTTFSQTPVKRLQFSADGKFLLSLSPDGRPTVFKTETDSSIKKYRNIKNVVGPAVWSPSGSSLFAKVGGGYSVWTIENGECIAYVKRNTKSVRSIAWLPERQDTISSDAKLTGHSIFLALKAASIDELDRNLRPVQSHAFQHEHLQLHDVAVTADRTRFLVVGTLTESPGGLKPYKGRSEKQIIVYNVSRQKIEDRIPILQDAQYIDLTKDDEYALVSYEDKSPPELWQLIHPSGKSQSVRLTLKHTYLPKDAADFVGPSTFGGSNDELVLSVERVGEVYIWDRDDGVLLRHIQRDAIGKDIQCIAWNPSPDLCMIAMGAEDGEVLIWTPQLSPGPDVGVAGPSGTHHLEIPPSTPANSPDTPSTQAIDHAPDPLLQQGLSTDGAPVLPSSSLSPLRPGSENGVAGPSGAAELAEPVAAPVNRPVGPSAQVDVLTAPDVSAEHVPTVHGAAPDLSS